ncbi:MAG: hypothetical protein KF688_18060 [Pirellulales bacterium]|nr:hypothetical protein [Pirellulales bacterium]
MTDEPTTTTLEYTDKIVVPGDVFREPTNEYWALQCLWHGLEYLNSQVASCEKTAKESVESGSEEIFSFAPDMKIKVEGLFSFGRLPQAIRGATPLLTMAFHWYAISAVQFVRLVGAIAKRLDDSRPLPKDYAERIIPDVGAFRDKVAAHFSWGSLNKRDNDAERLASVLPPLGYNRGRISVGTMTVHLRQGGKSSTSSEIKEWSLTEVHERLTKRYLPPRTDAEAT